MNPFLKYWIDPLGFTVPHYTWVSEYQKGKTSLDLLQQETLCTSPQADNHTSTPPISFFTGSFLLPNQQCQSAEGKY